MGRLTAGLAHDLNNLLGAVLGHTSLLEADLPAHHPGQEDVLAVRAAVEYFPLAAPQ